MGPETWGPHGWKFIHFITMGYPSNPSKYDKEHYKDFFLNLSYVIPCGLCADNYKDHLRIYPIDENVLSNRENLMEWGVKMHNLVNKSNGKEEYTIQKAFKLISKEDLVDRQQCNSSVKIDKYQNKPMNVSKLIILLTIIIFGFLLAYNFYKFYNLSKKPIVTI
tara:strand:- start:1050 stop:1541 length:492 start_codon:yes stop_codon:yes gene_type:complete